jgi:hypothetical protein
MCGGGGGGDGGASSREKARQRRIRYGMQWISDNFRPFNDQFFANRRKAYLDFTTPQLTTQYNDAYRSLLTALQRSGILQSSEAARRLSTLQGEYDQQKQGLVDKSYEMAARDRSDIENARSALVADLNVTSDPASANAAAAARQQILATNPTYQPLADLFTNTTAGLADYQEARENALLRRAVSSSIRSPMASTGTVKN